MAEYRVLKGAHRQGGKVYKKGAIVKSDSDLSEVFKNKFEKVVAPPAPVASAPVDEEEEDGKPGKGPKPKEAPTPPSKPQPPLASAGRAKATVHGAGSRKATDDEDDD